MHISLFLGPNVGGSDEDRLAIELCIEQALEADAAGFAAIYVGEQHFNNYEPYSDPIVMASHLSGQLTQAYLGTSMIPLPLHHPLFLIERINLLDQLTKGRCIIGLSAGRPMPMKAFPLPSVPGKNAQLFDEKLAVMLRAWSHDPADGPLDFATSTESGTLDGRLMPISFRRDRPLFAIGTNTASKIRDAGLAGRIVHVAGADIANTSALAEVYRGALREGEHSAAVVARNMSWFTFTKVIFVGETDEQAMADAEPLLLGPGRRPPFVHVPLDQVGKGLGELLTMDAGPLAKNFGEPESLAAFLQRSSIVGSPETVARQIRAYDEADLRHMHARFAFGSLSDTEPFRRSLRLFIDEVMPLVDFQPMPPLENSEIRPLYV